MGKPRAKSAKSGGKQGAARVRSIAPEVFSDKTAENLMGPRKSYQGVSKGNKTRNRAIDSGAIKRVKKPRVYTEKELGIPKLNRALDPMGVKVKGKKGKKFVTDNKMQQIIAEVNEVASAATATKLEKARHLEAIREAKRQEFEEKERLQREKLDKKKKEVRGRGKNNKLSPDEPVRKSKVRFA